MPQHCSVSRSTQQLPWCSHWKRLCGNYSPKTGDSPFATQVKAVLWDNLKKRHTDPQVCQDLWQASALDPRFKALPIMNAERRHEVFSAIANQLATGSTVGVKQEPGAAEGPAEGTPLTTMQSAINKEESTTGGDKKNQHWKISWVMSMWLPCNPLTQRPECSVWRLKCRGTGIWSQRWTSRVVQLNAGKTIRMNSLTLLGLQDKCSVYQEPQ